LVALFKVQQQKSQWKIFFKGDRRVSVGRGCGGSKPCLFLSIGEEDLLIVGGWGIRIGNYWREFFPLFFQKTKDGEVRLGMVGVALDTLILLCT